MLHLPQASDFTARALPANPFLAAGLHTTFNLCLGLESRNLAPLPDPRQPPAVLCARVLGYTLIEALSRGHMAECINEHSSDDDLLALGKYYIQGLLRVLKVAKRPTPPSSEHPSRPDLDDVQAYFERNRSAIITQDPGWDVGTLRCTHIFPEGLNTDLEVTSDEPLYGLQQDNQPDTYTVVSTISGLLERLPRRTVTFTTPDPEALPLPSPAYLAIHAVCCRVARLSGAADYVEELLREEEEVRERIERIGILAEDVSSMDLFERYMAAV
ncbi:hypothetical protein ARMGADRAFT_1065295 [Armillaria gallica]|uniref:HNH nuclease domain-containing protein n=1 Tax=Armillaria gallica TaxID=47427 RepID=A0A2H3D0Z0_ARMGA|nr:hypothetical protein ARMGADRAFT_1065295 [Armillaria gallica]